MVLLRKEELKLKIRASSSRYILTSFITANTSRDINNVKHADPDFLRPMADKEILDNILDTLSAGIDSVSKKFII